MTKQPIHCDYCKNNITDGNYKAVFSHVDGCVSNSFYVCQTCWKKAYKALTECALIRFYEKGKSDAAIQ